MDLIEEYRAAERPDYVTYGGGGYSSATPQTTLPDSAEA